MSDNFENQFETAAKNSEKKKKNGSGVKKFFGTLGLAIVFGIVASVFFKGTNEAIDMLNAKRKTDTFESSEKKEEALEEQQEVKTAEPASKEVVEEFEKDKEKEFGFENKLKEGNPDFQDMNDFGGKLSVPDVVSIAMPSIVAITNTNVQQIRSYYGMGIEQYKAESAGSGIVVGQNDDELLIATNAHVVADADSLTVCFVDEQAYEATIKGADTDNDLAVIAVKLSDISGSTLDAIKIAEIGDSNTLQIGEQVVAIGNAMGYGQSVTTGIVSALDRSIAGEDGASYIQTDAAINPGNSGGALLNMEGKLVGINSAKLANTKIEGMGYAIPISAANEIMEDLMNMVTRSKVDADKAGYLGISGFSVTNEVASAYNIPKGIYVSETTEGSAANRAGIQKGDVILKFDGMGMDSINKLRDRLEYYEAGEQVDIIIARADEGEYKEKTVTVTLDSRKGTPLDENTNQSGSEEKEPSDENEGESQESDNDGQRSGEFNIGGSRFQYSLPDNFFNFFNW